MSTSFKTPQLNRLCLLTLAGCLSQISVSSNMVRTSSQKGPRHMVESDSGTSWRETVALTPAPPQSHGISISLKSQTCFFYSSRGKLQLSTFLWLCLRLPYPLWVWGTREAIKMVTVKESFSRWRKLWFSSLNKGFCPTHNTQWLGKTPIITLWNI